MAETATPLKTVETPINAGTVSGRIERSVYNDGFYYTTLTAPAPDAYSHPSCIELRSRRELGAPGAEFSGRVRIGGYRRKFDYTDRQTGQPKKGENVRISLDLID